MKHLRHRSASAVLHDLWEFDEPRRLLIATARFGNVSFDFEKPVCLPERPRAGHFVIVRRGEYVWELTARECEAHGDGIVSRPARVHPGVPPTAFMLTDTPEDVSAELARL